MFTRHELEIILNCIGATINEYTGAGSIEEEQDLEEKIYKLLETMED